MVGCGVARFRTVRSVLVGPALGRRNRATNKSTAGKPQMKSNPSRVFVALAAALLCARQAGAAQSQEERNLSELRNTVVNLLQALVDRGVVTRDQAQALVKNAQDKAAADTAAAAAQEKEEAGAISVPYVPEIVKDQIKKEVAEQVTPEVTKQVIAEAKSEQWGVPGALPDWIQRISWGGDLRVRGEGDQYP